ncbi:MAG TPA: hypothetical protein VJ827_04215 [Rubrobacter sp.]|nr:hypothetical protein [Rubrobacter sp.]
MIRVCIEVDRGDVRSTLSVRAESILRALEIAGEQNPDCDLTVRFPLDPDTFFVRDASTVDPEVAEIAA